MKVTATRTTPAFEPIEIKIVIESKEELRVLREITGHNTTNTKAMFSDGLLSIYDIENAAEIFSDIFGALRGL